MLERPDLVRSPIALSKVVELLQAMLSPQLDPRRRALGGALPGPAALQQLEYVLMIIGNRNSTRRSCGKNAGLRQAGGALKGA